MTARNGKVMDDIANNNEKLRWYLDALGETEPTRLPLLPTCFSPSDRSPHIDVKQPNLLRIEYKGPGTEDSDSAQVRANNHIPLQCGIFYFEIRIISKGKEGLIGIGVSTKNVHVNKLPGWEKGSYGYHGDDGKKFRGCGAGESYGPTFTTGDVIGCIVNFLEGSIGYTKNGLFLGYAFTDVKERELYPTVGMRSEGECLELNCGGEPFLFDFHSFIHEERSRFQHTIQETTVPEVDSTACECILMYLVHQGYPETALALAKGCGRGPQMLEVIDTIRKRRNVLDAVLEGDIPKVLTLLQTLAPQLLTMRQDLAFMLKCQHFIELVKAGRDATEILEYGSDELYSVYDCDSDIENTPGPDSQLEEKEGPRDLHDGERGTEMEEAGGGETESDGEVEEDGDEEDDIVDDENKEQLDPSITITQLYEACSLNATAIPEQRYEVPPRLRHMLLERVFSLVAYMDPSSSPYAFLLDPVMRLVLADKLNAALQATDGWTMRPTLDRLGRQARVAIDNLNELSVVGLLLKDDAPLGYGDDPSLKKSTEYQAAHFFDYLDS